MDTDAIHLLLSSLEEVMKYNGDVRLASLRPRAELALRMAGVDRLFEIFPSTEAAAQSFQQRRVSAAVPVQRGSLFVGETENAA
jgi:anti-anti-sigma regulatory factor